MLRTVSRKELSALLALLPLLSLSAPAVFADSFVTDDLQTWQIGVIRGHITNRLLGYLDAQNNVVDMTSKPTQFNGKTHEGQLLIRPALGFQVNKYLSVWQGYGWTPGFQPQFRNENQIWEQVLLERNFQHIRLSSRTRLEIRRIQDADGTALRLRNQFRVMVPLGQTQWSLVAYDEPFFNLNTVGNGPRSGFNQNWLFAGINRRFGKNFNMEVGYLNNYVRNFNPVPDRMNHVIMIGLNMNVNNPTPLK